MAGARRAPPEDCYLIEGDVLFEENALRYLSLVDAPDVAAVASFDPPIQGSIALLSDRGFIAGLRMNQTAEKLSENQLRLFKTMNLFRFAAPTLRSKIVPALDNIISSGGILAYTEELLTHLIERGVLQLAVARCLKWCEIDTEGDLRTAERTFAREAPIGSVMSGRRQNEEGQMLKYLWDPANVITTGGIIFSSVSLFFAVLGRLELAVAAALWAVLSDHLDGVVATRIKNRDPNVAKMGKSLDGFGDILYGAVLLAVIVMQVSHASLIGVPTATALLIAGAIRLSYFANFGKSSDGRFLGVPLSYDIPLMAVAFVARPFFADELFVALTVSIFLVLAGLHVASIRVPSPNTALYVTISIFAIVASTTLALRGLN
ncbi:CDP-alcohol phosphatidyltransferase family protein [Bradyrhizobium valentinum]|uniref:CDP-alcohol phosphatidyltransferase family protein n=1 Tax=Bradyrhizobium valentinum TaxID=1518501 RepID=UPI001FD9AF71|nr:CDP-alcohol phosphatidyltransferase family protein [Bradyrhizobium valentinum]